MLWLLCIGLIAYVATVRHLRYARANILPILHGMPTRADFREMTTDQAQSVLKELVEMEFPKLMGFSIVFALFKTYGIPSVSSLLVSTGQLADVETTSKRTADTGVLLLEFCLNKPSSERAIKAISRMNYLHFRYQKSGRISNDDMLYTLSLFAIEPVRWIDRFEWRTLTQFEMCASGTFWKAMGDAMEISFAPLPSASKGWSDGLQWLEEIQAWSVEYEKKHMTYAKANETLASGHLKLLFLNIPESLKPAAKQVVATLVGSRLQQAMGLPTPTALCQSIINNIMMIRRWCIRHLFFPRFEFQRKKYVADDADPVTGRYSSQEYLSHPWYVKPTFKRRWGTKAWLTRLLGRKLPGDDGNRYAPEGYKLEEVGPTATRGKGGKEMSQDQEQLFASNRGRCPFHLG